MAMIKIKSELWITYQNKNITMWIVTEAGKSKLKKKVEDILSKSAATLTLSRNEQKFSHE